LLKFIKLNLISRISHATNFHIYQVRWSDEVGWIVAVECNYSW